MTSTNKVTWMSVRWPHWNFFSLPLDLSGPFGFQPNDPFSWEDINDQICPGLRPMDSIDSTLDQISSPQADFGEYLPEDSPPGLVSLSVDIAAWNQSVSQSQLSGSELFPLDQGDFEEMANQFLDPNMFKDDASMASSMDDSTYMSQPDTARQQGLKVQARNHQDLRRQTDVFPHQIYSPALSTSSQGGFHGAQSDMASLFLSSNAPDTEFGESAFSEFANYPTQSLNHTYHIPASSSSSRPADDGSNGWATDSPSFSRPFAMGSVDAVSVQNDMSPREFMKPSFPPYSQASSADGPTGGFMGPYASTTRPQMRRINTSTSTQSKLSAESEMAPQSATTQHSMGFIGPQFIDRSALQSPASSTGDHKPILTASAYEEEKFSAPLEHSAAESIISQDMYTDGADDGLDASLPSGRPVSEEADVKRARSHQLYSATPGPDDLYHCPFKDDAQCNHSPTKLKCNYDKYVDSHLKPFRCKVADCVEVQFSSTACLLRHEREAHAMHGHGAKPHLCYFPGCERSFPGHGFPRRYNLFDHMKRVHDYVEQSAPERTDTPVSSQAGGQKKPSGRKRKSTSGTEDQPEKRPRTNNGKAGLKMPPPQRQREQKLQRLNNQWSGYRDSLQQRLNSLQGPRDLAVHQQISDEFEALHDLARQITEMG